MGTREDSLRQVFGFFHVRGPPLGSAHLLAGDLGVGQDVVQARGGIVAGSCFELAETRLTGRPGVVEVGGNHVEVPVVGSGQGQIVRRLVLIGALGHGGTAQHGLLGGHIQEQVVLEGGAAGNDLQAEEAHVVGIVREIQVLAGVVFHHQGADAAGVDAQESTHTLDNGVVHKAELLDGRGAADVEDVTAAGTVGIDAGDFAAVIGHVAQEHRLAPFVDETLEETGNHAVLVADVANLLVVHGAAILVLDGKPVAGRGQGGGSAAQFHIFKGYAVAGPGVGELEFALDHRFGAVHRFLTHQGEAGLDVQRAHLVGGSFRLEEDLGALGLDGVLEGIQRGDLGEALGGRRGPGIHLAAGSGQIEEDEHVLGARIQAFDGSRSRGLLIGREGLGAQDLVGAGKRIFDAVHVQVIGHVLGPGQGEAGSGAGGHLQEEVVLDGEGLEGLAVFGQLGVTLAVGTGLYGEGIALVGVQFLLKRNGARGHFFRKEGASVGFEDREEIDLGIFGDIPGERDHVAQGSAYAGAQVHRLQAAAQVQVGDFAEFLLHAAMQQQRPQ